LYFVIQTADARAFFQFDFCSTLLLDLLAHDSAPFWGWILYSQKGKYLCPIGAQQISCFLKNRTKMQISREKWKMSVPFGKTGKRPYPSNTVMQRANLCCGAKPFSYFFPNFRFILYGEALEKFRKGKGIFQIFLV